MIGSLKAGGTRRTPFTVARMPLDDGGRSAGDEAGAETGVETRALATGPVTAGSSRDGRVWRAGAAATFTLAPFFEPLREPFFETPPPDLRGAPFFVEAIRGYRVGGMRLSLKIRRTILSA